MENREIQHNEIDIRVAITHGDYNGISYEVLLKTFADQRMLSVCTPIIYGSSKLISYFRKSVPDFVTNINMVKDASQAQANKFNLVNIFQHEAKVELGKSTEEAGKSAFLSLEMATKALKNKEVEIMVTGPINKDNIQSDEFRFPGHTEYLAENFQGEPLMLMVSGNLRIGVATGHIPLTKVSESINKALIIKKIRIMDFSLRQDFGIRKPKIAVLSVNPHSGDNGLLGKEEIDVLIPAIEALKEEGLLVSGPYSADGFFAGTVYGRFDAVLAMYHDQGLIPFKALAHGGGVNFTAGLPIVRTSPAHGTAYDIAGKDIANIDSFRESIYTAVDIYQNRKTYQEINANPLPFASMDKVVDEQINQFAEEI